jgi:hypothetical protein
VGAAPCRAQTDDVDASRAASARALFSEGVGFADQTQWADAADRFRRALALRDSPVIAYNLASALVQLGKLVEASELLRHIGAYQDADAELRKSAETTLAEISPRIGRITVHAEGLRPGDRVGIDDRQLLEAQLDVAVPIDPGVHLLAAQRGEEILDSRTIEVSQGGSAAVTLQLVRAPQPNEVARAAQTSAPVVGADSESKRPLTDQWWFWAGMGTAAVAVVVVAVLVASSGGSSQQSPPAGNFNPPVVHVKVAP